MIKWCSFQLNYRVCRQWRRIVRDNTLWRHVDLLNYRLDLKKMWKLIRSHLSECLLSIKIKGFLDTGEFIFSSQWFLICSPLHKLWPNLHTCSLMWLKTRLSAWCHKGLHDQIRNSVSWLTLMVQRLTLLGCHYKIWTCL